MNSLILNMRGTGTISTFRYASEKIGVHFFSIDLSDVGSELDRQLTQLTQKADDGHKVVLSLDIQSMTITPSLIKSIANVLSSRRMVGIDISAIDSVAVMVPAGLENAPELLKPLIDMCAVFDIKSSINPMETTKNQLFSESGIGNVLLARHLLGHVNSASKLEHSTPVTNLTQSDSPNH